MGLKCKVQGHRWGDGDFKQYCNSCNAFRTLISKRFPEIGETQIDWEVFELDDIDKLVKRDN